MHIPFHRQQTDYTCGPASIQMVFDYFGKHLSQDHLKRAMHTTHASGTEIQFLIEEAVRHGFFCYVNDDSSLHEIHHFLCCAGLPVIVAFIEPSSNEGHYSVVVATKSGSIILNDPWNGKRFRLSSREFIRRWHNEQNTHKKWIMVISKEDFHLGRQYRPEPQTA